MIKKMILMIAMLSQLSAQPLYEQDDKQIHFVASALMASTVTAYFMNRGYSKTEALIYGFGASMLVGVAKEAYGQHSYGGASADDIYADIAGAGVGSILSMQFKWEF